MSETKQINQEQEQNNNKLVVFANNILLAQENRITRAKDTSIKSIAFEFTAIDLGYNLNVVDKVRLSVTRESINKIVAKLLGCSVEDYKKVVVAKIEQAQAFTEYNTTIRALLKEHKHIVLKAIQG